MLRKFKIKILSVVLFIFVFLLSFSCNKENWQNNLFIENKSNKKIAFQALKNSYDTIFYCANSNIATTILLTVESNSKFVLDNGCRYSGWDTNLDLLTVFILDGELYEQYYKEPCDTIRKYVPVLHRYQLTLEDLQRMNWTVVYPPEEE